MEVRGNNRYLRAALLVAALLSLVNARFGHTADIRDSRCPSRRRRVGVILATRMSQRAKPGRRTGVTPLGRRCRARAGRPNCSTRRRILSPVVLSDVATSGATSRLLEQPSFRKTGCITAGDDDVIFCVSRAARAPALARHRRVRRVSPTRLPDLERSVLRSVATSLWQ
jgi:hypothetical protein